MPRHASPLQTRDKLNDPPISPNKKMSDTCSPAMVALIGMVIRIQHVGEQLLHTIAAEFTGRKADYCG